MPKAARARVASPPAGTALARAIRECLLGRVRVGRDSILCNAIGDIGQRFSDDYFSPFAGDAQRCVVKNSPLERTARNHGRRHSFIGLVLYIGHARNVACRTDRDIPLIRRSLYRDCAGTAGRPPQSDCSYDSASLVCFGRSG
jgi:hypothetical protein